MRVLLFEEGGGGGIDWEGGWTDEKNNILVEDLNTSDEVTIYFADEVHLGL